MAYKQDRNPGKIEYGPAGYRDPRKISKNYNALEFSMPDLDNIIDNKADGEQTTEDLSNKTGTEKEGVVTKGETVKPANADLMKKVENSEKVQSFIDEGKSLKGERKRGRQLKRGINTAIRQFERDSRKRGLSPEREEKLQAAKDERDRLRGLETAKKEEDKMIKKENKETEKEIKKANKNKIKKAQAEFDKMQAEKYGIVDGEFKETKVDDYEELKHDLYEQDQDRRWGVGTKMYKDMRPKNLMNKGNRMPEIDSEETRPAMYNQGRPMNSGILENNPNIMQPDNKVPFSQHQTNEKFSNIASASPDPFQASNTPNKPMGGLDQTFSQGQMAMYGMGPEFNPKLKAASEAGDLDDNPNFKAKVDAAPASHYHISKGKYANDTRVNKANYDATERDDAAHIDYLKKDIDYDAKHNKSDIDMTADEKHISKLAGDMKYDKEHHSPAYGKHGAAWKRKTNEGTNKRGQKVTIEQTKREKAEKPTDYSDNFTMNFGDKEGKGKPAKDNTVTFTRETKRGTKVKSAEGGTRKSKRLLSKFKRQTARGTREKAQYDQPGSFKGLVSKLQKKGKSKSVATKIAGKIANIKRKGGGKGPTAKQKARMRKN